jgi:hypothetical protein
MHTGTAMDDSKSEDKAVTIAPIEINNVADKHKLKHRLMRFFSIESARSVADAPLESTEVSPAGANMRHFRLVGGELNPDIKRWRFASTCLHLATAGEHIDAKC